MTKIPFAPKDAETLKQEFVTETGITYEENPELIDKLVAKAQKDEEFKAGLHADKVKLQTKLKELGSDDDGDGDKKPTPPEKAPAYSLADIRALSDVHDEDVAKVTKWATDNEISIAEAKADPDLQVVLKRRQDARDLAEASNAGGSRFKPTSPSGDALIEKARAGESTGTTKADFDALAEARMAQKRNANKR